MANYEQLKTAISAVVKQNGNEEITGDVLQNILKTIISTVGANRQLVGVATPTTAPGTPDANVFYLATDPGAYPNFSAISINENELGILYNNSGSWGIHRLPIATQRGLSVLEGKMVETSKTKNLFNNVDVLIGYYQPSSAINLVYGGGGWVCSNYIPIVAGEKYTISGNKNRVGVGFYNSQKQNVGYNSANTGTVTAPTGAVYMVINLTSDGTQWTKVMVEKSPTPTEYLPHLIVKKESVEGLVSLFNDVLEIEDKTDKLKIIPGINKLDPTKVVSGVYVLPLTGLNSSPGTNYGASGFIEVTPGKIYYGMSEIDPTKVFRNYVFYDENFTYISGVDVAGGIVQNIPLNAKYVRVSLYGLENYQLYGFYETAKPNEFVPYLTQLGVEDTPTNSKAEKAVATIADIKALNSDLTTVFEHAKNVSEDVQKVSNESQNLADPSNVLRKVLINDTNGGYATGTETTDLYDSFIKVPIIENIQYRALNIIGTQSMRKGAFYSAQNVFISGFDSLNNFVAPAGAAFVSFSVRNLEIGYMPENIGLFLYSQQAFEPYEKTTDLQLLNNAKTSSKNDNSVATIADVKNISNQQSGGLSFSKNANTLNIETTAGNYVFGLTFGRNLVANFNQTNIYDVAISNTDDAAPVHVMGTTLGANHGLPYNTAVTNAPHGLTNIDIGTEWLHSNGKKYYVIDIPTTTNIGFLSEPTGGRENFVFSSIPTGTITRLGTTLTISSIISSQFSQNTMDRSVDVVTSANDVVVNNGVYKTNYLDVLETYSFKNPYDVLQNLIQNQGTETPQYIGESMFTNISHFRFLENGTVVVSVTIQPNQNMVFKDFMFSQAIRIALTAGTQVYYYLPNSLPVAGYDFRKPLNVEFSTSVPALNVSGSSWADPTNPVNRVVQYYNNTGFCFGFLKDYGVGKKLQDYTGTTFEIRNNTGKVYPHGVDSAKIGTTILKDQTYNAVLFRTFTDLNETRIGNRLSMFEFEYNNYHYVILDYSGDMFDNVVINDKLNGKKIQVVESKNTALVTDIYNNGFFVRSTYIDEETTFIVLKLS